MKKYTIKEEILATLYVLLTFSSIIVCFGCVVGFVGGGLIGCIMLSCGVPGSLGVFLVVICSLITFILNLILLHFCFNRLEKLGPKEE